MVPRFIGHSQLDGPSLSLLVRRSNRDLGSEYVTCGLQIVATFSMRPPRVGVLDLEI